MYLILISPLRADVTLSRSWNGWSCKESAEIKSSCAKKLLFERVKYAEKQVSHGTRSGRMTCCNKQPGIQISNCQQSALKKSPFLKLGNNTLQKQVEKNAPRSNEGPPDCKMLTVFLFAVCSTINQSCYGSVDQMHMYGLFVDSPCRDSRRDKNKSCGR